MNIKTAKCILAFTLASVLITSCNSQNSETPSLPDQTITSPTKAIETESIPTETTSPSIENTDTSFYNNYFEANKEEALKGISTLSGSVKINQENVGIQSGKQALEIVGTIPATSYSSLSMVFEIETLFDTPTLDFSNKTIRFSYFVPEDSPIDVIVLVVMGETGQVSLANFSTIQNGDVKDKNIWLDAEVDVSKIYENTDWVWSDLSDEESRTIIKNAKEIMLAGMRLNEGQAVQKSFLIDNLKWIDNNVQSVIEQSQNTETIRSFADTLGLKISSTLLHGSDTSIDTYVDPWYRFTLATQFNMTSVGVPDPPKEKPEDISQIEFDYTLADETLDFAEQNGIFLYGGTGGWHTGNPRWITDGTYEELKTFLDRKIESNLTHYKGKVLYWGVFNEILDSDGISLHNRQKKDVNSIFYGTEWAPYGGRYSPYVDGEDTSLIEFAFTKARSVDANANLFLNEYGIEEIGTDRSDYFYNLVVDMKNRGVPIDGIGIQLHMMYPQSPAPGTMGNLNDVDSYLEKVDQNVKRYAEQDLFVAFTEFECQIRLDDIDLSTQEGQEEYIRRQQKQAEIYAGIMKIVKENPNVAFINFWSVADRPHMSAYDWSGMGNQVNNVHKFVYTDAFLFDKNYEPKPAYEAVLNVLKEET